MSYWEVTKIRKSLNGNKFLDVEILQRRFPKIDVKAILSANPEEFWICKNTESSWKVRGKGEVKYCFFYLERTCFGDCDKLHLCKDFLLSNCNDSICKFGFSHDIADRHNATVLATTNITHKSNLKWSFLTICDNHTAGAKCHKFHCGRLHICPSFIQGKCIGTCAGRFNHSFDTKHNQPLLEQYGFGVGKKDRQILLTNILLPRKEAESSCESSDEASQFSSSSSQSNQICSTDTDERKRQLNVNMCAQYLKGECSNLSCPRLHFCKEFLINGNKCSSKCKYGFSHDPLDFHNAKIMKINGVNHLNKSVLLESLRMSFPRVCQSYKNGKCTQIDCKKIHACFMQYCYAGICGKSHDLLDEHNVRVLKSFNLETLRGKKKQFLVFNILVSNEFQHQNQVTERTVADISSSNESFMKFNVLEKAVASTHNNSRDVNDRSNVCTRVFPHSAIDNPSSRINHQPSKTSNYNEQQADPIHGIALQITGFLNGQSLSSLSKLQKLFPDHENLLQLLQDRPDLFWVAQISENNWEVRGKRLVSLCYAYLNKICPGSCGSLHLCKEFLLSKKFCSGVSCKYGFSHDIHDVHNSVVLHDSNLNHIANLRSSFPRLCTGYVNDGICNKLFCGYLHICPDYVSGNCITDCQFSKRAGISKIDSHNFTLPHNAAVLKMFDLSTLKTERQNLLTNILYPKRDREIPLDLPKHGGSVSSVNSTRENDILIKTLRRYNDTGITYDEFEKPEKESEPGIKSLKSILGNSNSRLDVNNGGNVLSSQYPYSAIDKTSWRINHAPSKTSGLIDQQTESSTKLSNAVQKAVVPRSDATVVKSLNDRSNVATRVFPHSSIDKTSWWINHAPSKTSGFIEQQTVPMPINSVERVVKPKAYDDKEEKIIRAILTDNDTGGISIQHRIFSTTFGCGSSTITAKKWLQRHKDVFRIQTKSQRTFVHICIEELKPCNDYILGQCKSWKCEMFHICKDFIFGTTHNKRKCHFSHDLNDAHNNIIKSKLVFKFLSDIDLLLLLKIRFPKVCMAHQASTCNSSDVDCEDFHVCYNYMKNICKKKETLCGLKHESAFHSSQALRLMEDYHLGKDEFKKSVFLPAMKENAITTQHTEEDDFDPWKDEAICCGYLVGECNNQSCHLLHPKEKLPYLWQYKISNQPSASLMKNQWTSFPTNEQEVIELEFCDPAKNTFKHHRITVSFDKLTDPRLNSMGSSTQQVNNIIIRRLSTKSVVKSTDQMNPAQTEWIWYWKNGTDWTEYTTGTSCDKIEKAFLQTSNQPYKFKAGDYNYQIIFDKMIQKNMGPTYFTEREIKRRPLYKSRADIQSRLSSPSLVPNHWPQHYKSGQRISVMLNVYQKVKSDFETSIGQRVVVLNIQEVCNDDHYENFQRKKQKFQQKLQDPDEMFLYHGTDSTVVDSICAQNFEWRLCGKNATAYGQGSYFAKSAQYSHNYSVGNSSNVHYMFVASVLAGKSTLGNSSMKLPPLLPNSEHDRYDSCVDGASSIYIIFYKEQCYPRYLISYKEEQYATYVDRMTAAKSIEASKAVRYSTPRKTSMKKLSEYEYIPEEIDRINESSASSVRTSSQTAYQPSSQTGYQPYQIAYQPSSRTAYQPASQPSNKKNKDNCVIS